MNQDKKYPLSYTTTQSVSGTLEISPEQMERTLEIFKLFIRKRELVETGRIALGMYEISKDVRWIAVINATFPELLVVNDKLEGFSNGDN